MTVRKVKSASKKFISDKSKIEEIVVRVMDKITDIVGSSLGPGGRPSIIESDVPGLPNRCTKDGVTIFRALGAYDPFEHMIIETARDSSVRTADAAGDGTTTSCILSGALVKNLFAFCRNNPKFSPQRAMRDVNKFLKATLLPEISKRAIKISAKNQGLLEKVATVSANGDSEMAKAVISAFDAVGYGASSHITIQELSGPQGFEVELIEGFPIPIGYEDSCNKFNQAFINDKANQRCILDKPLFILWDGQVHDIVMFQGVLETIGKAYTEGNSDFKNVVFVAHGFSESVLTQFAWNFADPGTINIVPLMTPMNQQKNSQYYFLQDLAAFTGAKVFGMNKHPSDAKEGDFGSNMESFECYRFRSTVVGTPDPTNVELRADELRGQIKNPASQVEKILMEERLGKLTNGIAKLKVFGGSSGELKERHDRVEDAVCAVRNAISSGCLPGGCRILIDLALMSLKHAKKTKSEVLAAVLFPTLISPVLKLLDNSGYNQEEKEEITNKLMSDTSLVYDVAEGKFGTAEEFGLYDAVGAVEKSLENAVSIASVLGTLGGIVAFPRDDQLEREEARTEADFNRMTDNPTSYVNEANERP